MLLVTLHFMHNITLYTALEFAIQVERHLLSIIFGNIL